jgi:hypothetical protein
MLVYRIRDAAFWGESAKPSIDSIIRRLVKVGAKVVYHVRRWYVHIASAFSLARYYRILLVIGLTSDLSRGAATNWGEVVVS